jgi:hypothetical protein
MCAFGHGCPQACGHCPFGHAAGYPTKRTGIKG